MKANVAHGVHIKLIISIAGVSTSKKSTFNMKIQNANVQMSNFLLVLEKVHLLSGVANNVLIKRSKYKL